MGTTGLETAFAAVYTELVLPGVLALETGRRAHDRRAARCSGSAAPRSRVGEPANLVPRRPRGRVGGRRGRLREPLGELLLRRPARCAARVLLTVAAGAVAYRERAFAVTAA